MSQVETTMAVETAVNKRDVSFSSVKKKKSSRSLPRSNTARQRQLQSTILRNIKHMADSFFDFRHYYLHNDERQESHAKFWTSPLLISQYLVVVAALISRRLWVLHGILLIVSAFITYVVLQWISYIIQDPDLQKALVSMRWYFGFATRQVQATCEGGRGRRMVEGGFLAWQQNINMPIWQWYYRQRSLNVNKIMIQQHQNNMERFRKWQNSIRNA